MIKSKLQAFWLFLLLAVPQVFAKQVVEMGPILHFRGQHQTFVHQPDLNETTWHVSALYLLDPNHSARPQLSYRVNDVVHHVIGNRTAEKFGREYVIYDMVINQSNHEQIVTYGLPDEQTYSFVVPKKGANARLLYYSCNGYQSNAHRVALEGITPMWTRILALHHESAFHLQLGGGDQIYADGVIVEPKSNELEPSIKDKIHGVFALPTVVPLFKGKNFVEAQLSAEQRAEIDTYYFSHYKLQFNEPGFKEALASIPGKYQADDHDYYDGYGSYDEEIQQSPLLTSLGATAAWHVGITQHGLTSGELEARKNHTSLSVIDEGRLAILSIDTRTERNAKRVIPNETLAEIFNSIEGLEKPCEHLLVMLSVPVVYASTKRADQVIDLMDYNFLTRAVAKRAGFFNQLGKVELQDDARDGWSHRDHKGERNNMVAMFQDFAERKGIRVTFLSGDVHLGGMGKIYEKNFNDDAAKTIYQVISSPVGNMPAGERAASAIGALASFEQNVGHGSRMRLFKMTKDSTGHKAEGYLMSHRNFSVLQVNNHKDLTVRMNVEEISNRSLMGFFPERTVQHSMYSVTIPPVPVS